MPYLIPGDRRADKSGKFAAADRLDIFLVFEDCAKRCRGDFGREFLLIQGLEGCGPIEGLSNARQCVEIFLT